MHTMIMQDLKGQRHEMLDPFLVGKTLPGPQTCMNRLKRSYFIYHFGLAVSLYEGCYEGGTHACARGKAKVVFT